MIRLQRNKKTGDWYTADGRFMAERGCELWNGYDLVKGRPLFPEITGCTLKEFRAWVEEVYTQEARG